MAATLELDTATWDLTLDTSGNIAMLSGADALAQDAATAIRLFLGEYYWDTTVGVPYLTEILGQSPPLALLKQQLIDAALTVDGLASAQVFISGFDNRGLSGQVQIVSSNGVASAANFFVVNLQGAG